MTEPAVIAPGGELDLDSIGALAPQLDEAVAADYPRLILDLSAVTLVDSSAFGAIMQTPAPLQRPGAVAGGGRARTAAPRR